MPNTGRVARAAVLAAGLSVAACTVGTDESVRSIVVEYPANQPILAQRKADQFCAQFGAKAVLVQEEPISTEHLVRTRRATFECFEPAQ